MNSSRFVKVFGISTSIFLLAGVSAGCTPTATEVSTQPVVTVTATPTPKAPATDAPANEIMWADGTPIDLTMLDAKTAKPAGASDYQVTRTLPAAWEGERVAALAL